VQDGFKDMIRASTAADILYTPNISGVAANFLRPSIVAQGLDPDNLPHHGGLDMGSEAKAWKTLWSAGHGVGGIRDLPGAAELCERLIAEYRAAAGAVARDPFAG
jgi:nitronate monooxygenase